MFLYEAQTAFTVNAVAQLSNQQSVGLTICETGFNAGHSAALFLLVAPKARVVSFDLMENAYQKHALEHLLKHPLMKGHLTVVSGDSEQTVPAFAALQPSL